MSQAGKIIEIGGSGGAVGTLTGNSGGAVGPNGAGNINVVFPTVASLTQPGAGSVTGNPGTNTLTVNAWIQKTAATIGDTNANLLVLPVANDTAVTVHLLVNAVSSDFSRSFAATMMVGAVNDSGALSIIGTPQLLGPAVDPNGNVAQIDADVTGADLNIFVTGEAGVTYAWTALVYYVITT